VVKRIQCVILLFLLIVFWHPSSVAAPPNFAKFWKNMTVSERFAFLTGFSYGVNSLYNEITHRYKVKEENFDTFIFKYKIDEAYKKRDTYEVDLDILQKVITGFYKDPANSHIILSDMVLIALSKIKGANANDIEEMLTYSRKASTAITEGGYWDSKK
jgi:hypothetical protein